MEYRSRVNEIVPIRRMHHRAATAHRYFLVNGMRLTLVSVGLAIAAAVFLLVYPVYSGFTDNHPTHATLLQVNGTWALIPVLFPVVVALVPVLFPRRAVRIVVAVLLGAFAIVGGLSIGMFYVPAAVVMVIVAARRGEVG